MAPSYKLWRAELKTPTPEERRLDRSTEPHLMSGFWRIHAARTKVDYPVAIWTEADPEKNPSGATIFQIGRKLMNTVEHQKEWQDFIGSSWLKCTAVEQTAWSDALEPKGTGRWADNKPAREVTAAEKADIIPTTPASQGGNAPVDENGDPIDEFWLQVKEGLAAAAESLKELGAITSLETANKAAEIIERMRALGTQGEARRKLEKKPYDDAAAMVQAKWKPVLEPASATIAAAIAAVDKWRRAEETRIKREADEVARKERDRVAAIERERLQREADERARQAEQMGMEAQGPSEAEIEAEAQAAAAEQVAAPAEATVRVGTAHGRAVTKATIWGGKITDVDLFFQSIKGFDDTMSFLRTVADRLGRAKAVVPGMERVQK